MGREEEVGRWGGRGEVGSEEGGWRLGKGKMRKNEGGRGKVEKWGRRERKKRWQGRKGERE